MRLASVLFCHHIQLDVSRTEIRTEDYTSSLRPFIFAASGNLKAAAAAAAEPVVVELAKAAQRKRSLAKGIP
jgi:hypothetical protein